MHSNKEVGKVFLVVCTYNRDDYWQRCLSSLLRADLDGIDVIIVDDSSDNIDFSRVPKEWSVYGKKKNAGIKDSLIFGCDGAIKMGADVIVTLDGDALVRNDFMDRILDLHKEFKWRIVTGFNSRNTDVFRKLRNPVISEHGWYCLKKHVNGINTCFNKVTYEAIVRPILMGEAGNWDYAVNGDMEVPVTVPSVVQHIGLVSSMGHGGGLRNSPDVAYDFKGLNLPDVTLFGIDNRNPELLVRADDICKKDIIFGDEVIITDHNYWDDGREGYSRFCIDRMHEFINTSHVLVINDDGYVQNWEAWDSSWLEYDYIGAKWGYDKNNVGNGGFSLRSKRLMEAVSMMNVEVKHPEDDVICRALRPRLEALGMKFAPDDVADKFSVEGWFNPGHTIAYNGSFGFHGGGVTGLPKRLEKRKNV